MADSDDPRAMPRPRPVPGPAEARSIPDEDVRVGHTAQYRQADEGVRKTMEFMNSMTPEEAQKYAGQWIAVAGGEVVAHGEYPRRVCQEGRKAGRGAILVEYIAGPEDAPWLGDGLWPLAS